MSDRCSVLVKPELVAIVSHSTSKLHQNECFDEIHDPLTVATRLTALKATPVLIASGFTDNLYLTNQNDQRTCILKLLTAFEGGMCPAAGI